MIGMIPPPDLWGSTGYVATTEERFKEREVEEWGEKGGEINSLQSCSRQREVFIAVIILNLIFFFYSFHFFVCSHGIRKAK